ncbi:MAG: hypothetical protein A3F82_01390 [Deltaproteobacteria bacterium RIFCSPLOWO2_12_FULL_44_12]|nr:MAG: hypothetical protein A2712_03570 [Deltaproteobacteria bacterium RIFCSPHIGHO2_01_FULL_43_49]OGQ16271.1 MAG: hypothetical protein A3D22_01540 [Deltaproteobacteria bacterium RIFCSPHIGHO2_02_FULL_44_53]OGQ29231.1 MAG: hypothetical protein A3D98_05325 [Deltaproteobacteria bacterium RIFCSPHIGHO2_12_FULL_44_21]OGQ32788.1 MAG: hypothetical protein A2979_09470 [Deltaproteobacteria bacterium RIFCSPLOWO2_01_FULL_45_74]OGQ41889.1 MAG: hypothetical protein A3I70_09255 [Deltaproteobacteria bacterium 
MSLSIITKIVGFTIVSRSSDPATRKRVDELSNKLKEHEGRLLPRLDQSVSYVVNVGDQKQYFRRLTSSNPTVMKFEFIDNFEKVLNIENNGKLSIGCSPSRGNCGEINVTEFIPAEVLLDRPVKNDQLCWHLQRRFSDEDEKILSVECRDITLTAEPRDQIDEACKAAQEGGLPIEEDKSTIIQPQESNYLPSCNAILTLSVSHSFQMWTSPLIKAASDYAKTHKIPVVLLGSQHPHFAMTLTGQENKIRLGLMSNANLKESDLIFGMDHEAGHFRDQALLVEKFPKLRDIFQKNNPTLEEISKVIEAYLVLIKAKISKKEKSNFEQMAEEIFGDFKLMEPNQLMHAWLTINELFRTGEQVHDRREEAIIMSSLFSHLKKDAPPEQVYRMTQGLEKGNGEWIDLLKLSIVAEIQEAGLWEKFTAQKDYDPESVKHLNPKHIAFFRQCIRAAGSYFKKKD